MRPGSALLLAATLGCVGCGDGGTSPPTDTDGARLASRFEQLADSVDSAGYTPTALALRHAAEIVRLTGHATSVALTVDGTQRPFLAVAEQLDFPTIVCSWPSDSGTVPPGDSVGIPPGDSGSTPPGDSVVAPPPDSGSGSPGGTPGGPPIAAGDSVPPTPPPGECTEVGTFSMRTLIAWEPERMAEVVRVVADVGANTVAPGVPDVMTGLPTNPAASPNDPGATPPDSGGGTGGGQGWGGYPGFMGEYLVADQGTWLAVEGSQTNAVVGAAGACTSDRAVIDWAEFRCQASSFRFGFTMRVEPLRITPVPSPMGGTPPEPADSAHTLALAESAVDGVTLSVVAWSPPPLPPMPPLPSPGPDPLPPDTAVTNR